MNLNIYRSKTTNYELRTTGQAGFSIIELLLVVVFLSLLITAIIPLFTKAITTNKSAKNKLNAYEAASSEIEELRSTPFENLADGTFVVSGMPNAAGAIDINNTVDGQVRTNIVTATVTVNWTELGNSKQVSLVTYISEKGINQ